MSYRAKIKYRYFELKTGVPYRVHLELLSRTYPRGVVPRAIWNFFNHYSVPMTATAMITARHRGNLVGLMLITNKDGTGTWKSRGVYILSRYRRIGIGIRLWKRAMQANTGIPLERVTVVSREGKGLMRALQSKNQNTKRPQIRWLDAA